MIRAEVKTPHKCFVYCEDTLEEAKAYAKAMQDNGVIILDIRYYDNDERIREIWDTDYRRHPINQPENIR